LPKPYNETEDAAAKIAELIKKAKKENKNIMIQTGGNWCIWCLRFNNYVQTTPELKKLVDDNYLYYHLNYSPKNKNEKIFEQYMVYSEKLKKYIVDADILINKAIDSGKNVLFEGAQGTLLDIDHGTYPYVTSSNTIAGGACTGTGVSPTKIDRILGIVKAYTTRVGEGPFPTEIKDSLGEEIRKKGGEYGATTGRPRRCGWLDFVGLRHALRVNGFTGIAITKLDILDGMDKIKVCVGYKYGNTILEEFPKEIEILQNCIPIYEELPGWSEKTAGIRDYEKTTQKCSEISSVY